MAELADGIRPITGSHPVRRRRLVDHDPARVWSRSSAACSAPPPPAPPEPGSSPVLPRCGLLGAVIDRHPGPPGVATRDRGRHRHLRRSGAVAVGRRFRRGNRRRRPCRRPGVGAPEAASISPHRCPTVSSGRAPPVGGGRWTTSSPAVRPSWCTSTRPRSAAAPVRLASLALTVAAVAMVSMRRRRASTSEVSRLRWAWCGALVMVTAHGGRHRLLPPSPAGPTASVSSPSRLRWRCRWRWCSPRSRRRSPFADRAARRARSSPPVSCCWQRSVYVVIVLGLRATRPTPNERPMLAASLVAAAPSPCCRSRRGAAWRRSPTDASMASGDAPDEALQHVRQPHVACRCRSTSCCCSWRSRCTRACAAPRRGLDGDRRACSSSPSRARPQRRPVTLAAEELRSSPDAAFRARAGSQVWLPALAEGRATRPCGWRRVAHSGELLGLIVARARRTPRPFNEEEDRVLTELARQVGLALHNVRLDSALQAILDELQLRNVELAASRARSSPPPTRAGARSSATCTTAPSSTWSHWR